MSNLKDNTPTKQQENIINFNDNLVVLAKPGSGKTYTISEMIKRVLARSLDFQGVIAISFTNKASDELRNRVLKSGIEKKGSFFDTMSTFYLMEIIYPFGGHLFTKSTSDFKIYKFRSDESIVIDFRKKVVTLDFEEIPESCVKFVGELYSKGVLILELLDALALYIYENSIACRKYIRSKYTHIFIDEYQDSGYIQNKIFLSMVNDGLIGIAVGDKDQSIYGFSGKNPKFLTDLIKNRLFTPFFLDTNFRCHEFIVQYSLRLLNPEYKINEELEKRIIRVRVDGDESKIAQFIDTNLDSIKKKFEVKHNNQIAILVKSNFQGQLISSFLNTKHKYFKKTELDEDSSLWASIFKKILSILFSNSSATYSLCKEYYDENTDYEEFINLFNLIELLKSNFSIGSNGLINDFRNIATIIHPNASNHDTLNNLKCVLGNRESILSYTNANKNEVQLMTLHKSKGLEFSVVFHLNMNKYILPEERIENGNWIHTNYEQCLNLHYVGITRAEKAVFLVTSRKRTNSQGILKNGEPSEFFTKNNLDKYSMSWTSFKEELAFED